jgi:hypothetical protein
MRIDSSGNVGIGISAPAYRLDVRSGATATAGQFNSTATTAYNAAAYNGGAARLVMYGGNATGSFTGTQFTHGGNFEAFFGAVQNASALADFVFQGYNGSAYAERMRIDSSGNVGIGTTAGAGRLNVLATSTAQAINILNRASDNIYGGIYFKTSDGATDQSIILNEKAGTNGAALLFYTKPDGGSTTERMRIDSSGNVGIGNTIPGAYGARLAVGDPSNTSNNALLFLTQYATFSIAANGVSSAAGTTFDYSWSTGGQGPLIFSASNVEAMRIDGNRNLLVGTTSASCGGQTMRQHINATDFVLGITTAASGNTQAVRFAYGATAVGSITLTGSTTTYNTSSDYRLKEIDGPIANSGAYIDALKPVQGSWKADGSRFIGLLAHEVQEVSETPIATGEKDGEKMQAMDYSAPELIANLIAEIQSLRARVAQLEGN